MLLVKLFLVCLAVGLSAANDLKATQDNWVLDKLNDSSVEISGSKLSVKYPENGYLTPHFNALYQGLVANEKNKKYVWEFTCVKNCYSVGVAKKGNYFLDGHSIKGAFVHYNLHNNGELLVSGFTDGIEDGDRITYILDAGEQELKIYIVQNDRPLGLAYIQKAPYSNEIHPAVVFAGPGTVEIKEKKDVNTDNLLTRMDYVERGVKGDYRLVKVIVNGTEQDIQDYNLRLSKPEGADGKIQFDLHVGNYLNGLIVKAGKDAEGDLYSVRDVSTTAMGIFGKMGEDEATLFGALPMMKRMKFSEQFDELTIISEPNTTLVFKRFLPVKMPHETSDLLA